jgi:hypothetical protein
MHEWALAQMRKHKIMDVWTESGEYKCLCACGHIYSDSAKELHDHLTTVFFGE